MTSARAIRGMTDGPPDRVAVPWFRRRWVSARLTRIEEPFVDTGLGIASLRSELPELFERSPMVVLTHAHLDHIGGRKPHRR
jgi:glyoxylase-like metal-dependent hydrolase (beta-lactamase superfamily II)